MIRISSNTLVLNEENHMKGLIKNLIKKHKSHYVAYVTSRLHFCDNYIRVSTENDRVWSPEYQYRIIQNNKKFKFLSIDLNGLHCYLTKGNFRIFGGFSTNSFIKKTIIKIYNLIVGFKFKIIEDIKIYHLHYLNLEKAHKKNDLRYEDLKYGNIIFMNHVKDGLKHDYLKGHKICCINDNKTFEEIKKYT
jgi:hypothetical protein